MSKRRHAFSPKYRPRGLNILYEDGDILVIDKEEGLLTMSPRRDESRTAERYLTHYLRKGASRSRLRVFVVHRLDRETSGVLVFAKSALAQRRLKDDWKNTEKFYLAAVHGHPSPKSGVITSYLAEDDDQFVRSVPEPTQGRFAKTAYSVIKETPALSILKVQLLTGRKNQIRVHTADMGHPVCGDIKYGNGDDPCGRLCLHAYVLCFYHPVTHQPMEFETPIPNEFVRAMKEDNRPFDERGRNPKEANRKPFRKEGRNG